MFPTHCLCAVRFWIVMMSITHRKRLKLDKRQKRHLRGLGQRCGLTGPRAYPGLCRAGKEAAAKTCQHRVNLLLKTKPAFEIIKVMD